MDTTNVSGPRLTLSQYRQGVLRGDRVTLSRAITLVESALETDRMLAATLIEGLLPHTGSSIRIGITGAPGVGKSSFIEVFGQYLTGLSKKVAVLTIDPGSHQSRGSVLGDKTRMENLSRDPNAFIRPTSAGTTAGGIHSKTREAILLCEAAGFDVLIIETVGAGQLEVDVYEMVDFLLLLIIGGAGDSLQGIKRGVMEIADGLAITQADGDGLRRAQEAKISYELALRHFPPAISGCSPEVLISSAVEKKGADAVWDSIKRFRELTLHNGSFEARRRRQLKSWFKGAVEAQIRRSIGEQRQLSRQLEELGRQVLEGKKTPTQAASAFDVSFRHALRPEPPPDEGGHA